MTEITQADHDAAEEHFNVWYPDTAWGYDALVDTLARHREQAAAEERANGRIEALQADNAKLREVLQGVTPPAYFGESEESKAWWTKARTTLQETDETFTRSDDV